MHKPYNNILSILRLLSGILIISGIIWFLGWCTPPKGVLRETIRHNLEEDIDATPIFYGDVENMTEIEAGLRDLIEDSENK